MIVRDELSTMSGCTVVISGDNVCCSVFWHSGWCVCV